MPAHIPETCLVPKNDTLFQRYHDEEWGVPAAQDQTFFEKICLEGFQSGLSWKTILHKRSDFRLAFSGFDGRNLRKFTDTDVDRVMADQSIVRNRQKICSTINNAHRLLELQREFGSLAGFFWSFEPDPANRPELICNQWLRSNPFTSESMALSFALKQRGWSFVGPTTMYAVMQALGIVNDHVQSCPRRMVIEKMRNQLKRPRVS